MVFPLVPKRKVLKLNCKESQGGDIRSIRASREEKGTFGGHRWAVTDLAISSFAYSPLRSFLLLPHFVFLIFFFNGMIFLQNCLGIKREAAVSF